MGIRKKKAIRHPKFSNYRLLAIAYCLIAYLANGQERFFRMIERFLASNSVR
jgi:hypothetical protein